MTPTTKFTTVEQPKSFIINDCTGIYTPTNKTGWGGLNARVVDVTESYFEITTPNGPLYKVNVYPDFPNSDGYGYEILPYMVGNTEGKIDSGTYKIKWIVKGVAKGKEFTATAYYVSVFKNDVFCCVDKHIVKLDKNISTDEYQKKIVEMSNIMEATNYAIEKGLLDTANKNIEYLKLNCDTCC